MEVIVKLEEKKKMSYTNNTCTGTRAEQLTVNVSKVKVKPFIDLRPAHVDSFASELMHAYMSPPLRK